MHWIDPDFLPGINGTVERFIANSHGEIDGILLAYEGNKLLLVHVPPHLDQKLEDVIRPGDAVRVRGVRPRGADMIAAVSITAQDGCTIVDNGPDDQPIRQAAHPGGNPKTVEHSGTVRLSLYGPKGELRGALLEDGSIVRLGPKEAVRVAAWLAPRAFVAVRGNGIDTKHGRVVAAKEIGADFEHLEPAKAAKPENDDDAHALNPQELGA
jgi:hypothetical protein